MEETRSHGAGEFTHAVHVKRVRAGLVILTSGNKNNFSVTRLTTTSAVLDRLLFSHVTVLQVTDGTAMTTIGDENHARLGTKLSQTVLNKIIRDDSRSLEIGRYQALVSTVRFVFLGTDVGYTTTMTAEMNPRGVDLFGPRATGQVVNLGEHSATRRVTSTECGVVGERANVVKLKCIFEDQFHVAYIVNATAQTSVSGVAVV